MEVQCRIDLSREMPSQKGRKGTQRRKTSIIPNVPYQVAKAYATLNLVQKRPA